MYKKKEKKKNVFEKTALLARNRKLHRFAVCQYILVKCAKKKAMDFNRIELLANN